MKKKEIQSTIEKTEQIILQLRQASEGVWNNVNEYMTELILTMTTLVEWAQQVVKAGEDFPIEVVLQQVQNLNEAYRARDEVLLADTLEYEVRNALEIYLENGEE